MLSEDGADPQRLSRISGHHHRHSGAAGPPAVEPVPYAHRDRAGRDVDSRRPRSHHRGGDRPGASGDQDARTDGSGNWGTASAYVVGAVCGALVFGWLTDRFGRKFVFYVTLLVYLAGVMLTATSWSFWSFAIFRVITGVGIGGEYAAINSAIDELIPARYRGRVDPIVNGSFWPGAAVGSGASLLSLDPHILPADLGWRFGFAIGGVLGLGILLLRGYVPESPRWLVIHGWKQKADAAIEDIEQRIRSKSAAPLAPPLGTITVHPRRSFGLGLIMNAMLGSYRSRSLLALTLMTAQAFLFNAVFFSYGLVLSTFHGVPERTTGIYEDD
jgi:MFS family permease